MYCVLKITQIILSYYVVSTGDVSFQNYKTSHQTGTKQSTSVVQHFLKFSAALAHIN